MSLHQVFRCPEVDDSGQVSHETNAKFGKKIRGGAESNYRLEKLERHQTFFRYKYMLDRWIGSVLLVLTSPLLLVLFVLVKLTSPGPGFYRQTRVGLDREPFEIIKLRSMVNNAEAPGKPVWSGKNDCRVTWLGKILRKLHLDELPQLWNVAVGEMSLVGPRPERPQICEDLANKIDGYYRRTQIKPGVTGLAQINLPPDISIEDVRRKQILDLHYIEEANWWLDFRMLIATTMRMVGIKGEVVMKAMRLCRRDLLSQDKTSQCSLAILAEEDEPSSPWNDASDEPALACVDSPGHSVDLVESMSRRIR